MADKGFEVVYTCHTCKKEFKPDDVPCLEEFNEEGDWDFPCPICKSRLVWVLK